MQRSRFIALSVVQDCWKVSMKRRWFGNSLQRSISVTRQASVADSVQRACNWLRRCELTSLSVREVIVECKAVIQYNSIFEAQLLTYLRLTNRKLDLVINFGERLVKDGIHRVVNGLCSLSISLCVFASLRLCVFVDPAIQVNFNASSV